MSDDPLVRAQDRTTHAVRAIARFLLILVTYELIAAVIIGISLGITITGGSGEFLIFVGGATALGGLFHATSAGWSELDKSQTDYEPRTVTVSAVPTEQNSAKNAGANSGTETLKSCRECSAPLSPYYDRCPECGFNPNL